MVEESAVGDLVQKFVEALDAKVKADMVVENVSEKLLVQPFSDFRNVDLSSKLDDIITLSGLAQEHVHDFQYLSSGRAIDFSDLEACVDESGFEDSCE